jgi:nitric oxide reductase subunit B
MKKPTGILFIITGLVALLLGIFFGAVSGLQFIFPGFFEVLPFFKSRPLHVSLVVAWIFSAAVGGIYYYLPNHCNLPLYSKRLPRIHFALFIITGLLIIVSYMMGKFGGREYWEFPPLLAIPIIIGWLLFGFNYFKTVVKKKEPWPVYLWMWATGIFFFLFTFSESYLWLLPYFRNNVVRELTVQWKSYGALVGSWNMLVYGTAIFVMEKLSGDKTVALSRLTFLMYFLGLTNLMFGWAHHIYIVPSAPWIRHFAYLISMTELLILAKIIWNFSHTIRQAKDTYGNIASRFMASADVWIFINLILALLISIPAVNIYTHGTHITVAHAMGSTIGINTMILFSSCFYIIQQSSGNSVNELTNKLIGWGFWIVNGCLLIFFISLVAAGIVKGYYTVENQLSFQEIMQKISPILAVFVVAGLGIFAGMLLIILPALRKLFYSPVD